MNEESSLPTGYHKTCTVHMLLEMDRQILAPSSSMEFCFFYVCCGTKEILVDKKST